MYWEKSTSVTGLRRGWLSRPAELDEYGQPIESYAAYMPTDDRPKVWTITIGWYADYGKNFLASRIHPRATATFNTEDEAIRFVEA